MILLDTNVVSELMKATAALEVERWFLENEGRTWLPAVVLGELAYGIARLPEGKRRQELGAKLVEWRIRYADRVVVFGATAAHVYGPMLAGVVAAGRTMSLPDAQIAACAIDRGAMLATRNVRDFDFLAVDLIDPWAPAPSPA